MTDQTNAQSRPYLQNDHATIRLDDSVIATPLLELSPVVVRTDSIPADVEEPARRQQPHNSAFDRTAGSHSLAAAGQRRR
jgi:hypothetical protein